MNVEALRARLAAFPRLPLATLPTPLELMPRLSAPLGGPTLWVKRDDGIGPALGGNKARKLEFLLAEAQARGARQVVTFGGLQSNHARMTAAAACALGIEPHLFFFERCPNELSGNLLLESLLGAKLHFLPFGGSGGLTLERANRLVRLLAQFVVGPKAYFIPVGGHSALGALGYALCAAELHEHAAALGLRNATVVTAAGTGGTLAGLLAGFALLGSPLRVLGIDVGKLWQGFPASIAHLAGEVCALLSEPRLFAPADVPLIEKRYVGPAYAIPTSEGTAAIRQAAECEGLILDPVYTGKALAGLLDLVRQGHFGRDETVIFLHTGGVPALFAFADQLVSR
jgi:D-cysteine desulfhydrase family pyridoxal phosphate-dependent enzyme